MRIFEQVKQLGIPYSNHESDLYLPVNDQTREMVATYEFKENVKTFRNNIDGKLWYDIPFAYLPYWEAKQKNR